MESCPAAALHSMAGGQGNHDDACDQSDVLRSILEGLARGECTVAEALDRIRHLPFTDVERARLDHHLELRTGTPKVVFGEGKTSAQIVTIAREMLERSGAVLVTRLDPDKAAALVAALDDIEHHADARLAMRRRAVSAGEGSVGSSTTPLVHVAAVSAGTSDQPVAEEAARTLEFPGIEVRRYRDAGVSGIHRLLAERERLAEASVVVVMAGMEGALPRVVVGLA